MVWTNFSFQTNQALTSAQLNNLQANFPAMVAGEAGFTEINASLALMSYNFTEITTITLGGTNPHIYYPDSGTWLVVHSTTPYFSNLMSVKQFCTSTNSWHSALLSSVMHSDGANLYITATFSASALMVRI